ncbi:hypothetical protein B8V81_4719 [Paenibacillus pasadenensis]|uniref:Uncharacterized protein n=1 Tax=Paenibacillus pasadenensis TaxID=217090 RepID=A0A2N5N7H8_9BACL|nr:hypothetical protein B8V81_4719 [Paenibacillus pasadenensis]
METSVSVRSPLSRPAGVRPPLEASSRRSPGAAVRVPAVPIGPAVAIVAVVPSGLAFASSGGKVFWR